MTAGKHLQAFIIYRCGLPPLGWCRSTFVPIATSCIHDTSGRRQSGAGAAVLNVLEALAQSPIAKQQACCCCSWLPGLGEEESRKRQEKALQLLKDRVMTPLSGGSWVWSMKSAHAPAAAAARAASGCLVRTHIEYLLQPNGGATWQHGMACHAIARVQRLQSRVAGLTAGGMLASRCHASND